MSSLVGLPPLPATDIIVMDLSYKMFNARKLWQVLEPRLKTELSKQFCCLRKDELAKALPLLNLQLNITVSYIIL